MLFDLSKKQEVKIEFIAKDGEAFSHSKVISAGFLSFLEKINTNLGKKLKVNKCFLFFLIVSKFITSMTRALVQKLNNFVMSMIIDI